MTRAAALDHLADSYLDLRWNMDPVAATRAGIAAYDGRLGAYGSDELRGSLAALKSVASALEECTTDSLEDEIDRTALLDEIRVTVHEFEREQPHVRDPGFWVSHVLEGLYLLLALRDRSRDHRAKAAGERVRGVAVFLKTAQATLRNCPHVFVHTAVQVLDAGVSLLDRIVEEFADAADPPSVRACRDAQGALRTFREFLTDELLDGPDADFAIGEDAFNFRLHFQHALRGTAPELWRYGLSFVEEVERDVADAARAIDGASPWRAVVDRLRADQPAAPTLVQAYGEEMERARRFVEEHGIVPVPSGDLEVVATPEFLRPLIPFAAYQPPGAFSADRTGWFYVTPPDDPGPASTNPKGVPRDHCVHELAGTALHEGYPGHHLHFLHAHASPRAVRRVVSTPLMVEGWALYCEHMMAEHGFYATPEERLFQKVALLWRAVRILADVGLHTRGIAFQEAVDLLLSRVPMERAHAVAEVRRYCTSPGYQLCYAVGCRELLALREAARAAGGREFVLRRFHEQVLEYGGLPISLIRWGMGLEE